jgi:hypothetical protein
MSDIVTTCRILHNLCMITNKTIEDKWIVD